MDVIVEGTPESCLTQVEAHFARDWAYGGNYNRPTPNTVNLFAQRRTLIDSGGGILLLAFLALITGGAFLVIYFFYFFFVVDKTYVAQIVATPEGEGRTRLSVTSNRQDWAKALESWVQQELVENRAAAVAFAAEPPATPASIPEQIKKLAELRDSGAITEEEFERKKAELLDRM